MSALEHEIRAAAESLLGSSSSYQQRQSPTSNLSHSVNSRPEFLLPADLVTGARQHGRMSVVRRFFCLFVTFDFLFTGLMWLICIMEMSYKMMGFFQQQAIFGFQVLVILTTFFAHGKSLVGGDMMVTLSQQIVHYNVHTSLFDIVLAAACRFTVLLLFYGFIYINHWCIIALSTATTCMFLIAKVYVYHWPEAPQPAFHVLLILASFVIAWGEAWFLDFRVLPQEQQAQQFLQASPLYSESERTPLLRNFLMGLPLPDENTESVGNFYSPLDTPQGSDDERDPPSNRRPGNRADKGRTKNLSAAQKDRYRQQAVDTLDTAWHIINTPDWKLEKRTTNDECFYSRRLMSKKVYKMVCKMDFPPEVLFHELCVKVEDIPKWNPTITQTKIIQPIDEHTDIMYMVAAGGAGGLVQSRDFVNLRHWGVKDDCFVAAAISVMHPDVPSVDKHIRGENGASCWVIRPVAGSEGCSKVEWLLNTNLRGWIPQSVVDTGLITTMLDYTRHLTRHVAEMAAKRS